VAVMAECGEEQVVARGGGVPLHRCTVAAVTELGFGGYRGRG
jgi:hypothetical protein